MFLCSVHCIALYSIVLRRDQSKDFLATDLILLLYSQQLYCTVTTETLPTNSRPVAPLRTMNNDCPRPIRSPAFTMFTSVAATERKDNTFVIFIFFYILSSWDQVGVRDCHSLCLISYNSVFLWFIKTKNVNMLTSARWWKYKIQVSQLALSHQNWQVQSENQNASSVIS